jgi:isopentenyl diphosphate isomerase/L-lactate dehydrogenase-like FMN-dependent dehydrogenase
MNAATTFTAGTKITCPCCGKSVKVTRSGALANHGYAGVAGNMYSVSRDGSCRASGATTVEQAVEAKRSMYRDCIEQCEALIAAGKQVGWNTGKLNDLRKQLAAL